MFNSWQRKIYFFYINLFFGLVGGPIRKILFLFLFIFFNLVGGPIRKKKNYVAKINKLLIKSHTKNSHFQCFQIYKRFQSNFFFFFILYVAKINKLLIKSHSQKIVTFSAFRFIKDFNQIFFFILYVAKINKLLIKSRTPKIVTFGAFKFIKDFSQKKFIKDIFS